MEVPLTQLQREIREVFLMKVIHELSLKSIIKKEPGETQGMRRCYTSHLGFSIYKNVETRVNRNVGKQLNRQSVHGEEIIAYLY